MKIGYSKTFPNIANGEWEKVWCEEEFEGTLEQARSRWYAQKKEVENFHYESKGHDEKVLAEKQSDSKASETPINAEAKMISDILLCDTLEGAKGLESFKFLAEKQKEKCPDIWAAYLMMEKKLSK